MTEELEQKVELMKREIDALQISILGQKPKPWYRNISTILSVVALLFSFGTTYVSYLRNESQDIQSARQELRTLLQRLATLPKENVDNYKKFADDPASMNLVGGFINQENAMLARQAAEIAKKLPVDLVSGTEHYAIAVALQNSYDLAAADEFLKYAIQAAKDFNTEIAALRSTANLQFIQGRPESGRVEYQKALNIFSKYSGYDPFTKTSTNIWTELAWAISEANMGLPAFASQHMESAKALVNGLPRSPGADMLRAQLSQAEVQFASGLPVSSPVSGPQLGVAPLSGTK
jgi:tetratricopeptide (TPR) repeat protein